METQQLVAAVRAEMQKRFASEGSGHDWEHILRVHDMACFIAAKEEANTDVVALAALLHDIADHKFYGGDLSEGPRQAGALIIALGGEEALASRVAAVVSEVSFKGAGVATPVSTREAAAVQDADRLDAIGAIGIARAFAYGGSKGRPLHLPDILPQFHDNFDDYANSRSGTINHFYEKLLLIKDRLHTDTARQMARERHAFMASYLSQFLKEWGGGDYLNG